MADIREISAKEFDEAAFVELLRDAVDAGASVGYLAPLATDDGRAFWRSVKSELADGRVLLGAYADGKHVGTSGGPDTRGISISRQDAALPEP